ncbi:transposase [Sphingobacterium multivorum]|nr:transposase [Sphingobacterium multivorum]
MGCISSGLCSCEGCPLRGQCHKAQGNRLIEVNHRLNELKAKARQRLTSETGLYHRSKRPIEVEVVFGQMKSNNKFNRFTMRGLEKVDIEFALMCIGHNLRKWSKKLLKTTSSGPDDQPKYNNPLTYGLHWVNYPYEPMAA